jgi:hypothetical protein
VLRPCAISFSSRSLRLGKAIDADGNVVARNDARVPKAANQ